MKKLTTNSSMLAHMKESHRFFVTEYDDSSMYPRYLAYLEFMVLCYQDYFITKELAKCKNELRKIIAR